jgi:hypothetical protein
MLALEAGELETLSPIRLSYTGELLDLNGRDHIIGRVTLERITELMPRTGDLE